MTTPQDPFRAPDGQPGPYGPPPGAPGSPTGGGPDAAYGTQPAGYGAPAGYGGYGSAPAQKRNGMGTAALVLGVLALVLFWTILGGVLLGIAAIVLGLMGRGRAKRGEADNGGTAIAGVVLGVLGLLASIALVAAGASFLSQNRGSISDLTSCLQEAQGDPNAERECQVEFEDELTGR